jgi:uncharacterized protein
MTHEGNGFVIPLTHLQRRPGNLWETVLPFQVPSDMGVGLAQIDPSIPIEAHLRLESVMDGVLATADLNYEVLAECARCLDPLAWSDSTSFVELFLYPETDSRGREVAAAVSEDLDSDSTPHFVNNDCVDLEDSVRDAIVLGLPLKPLCSDSCEGLCTICGEKLGTGSHDHPVNDPRWDALAALRDALPPVSD